MKFIIGCIMIYLGFLCFRKGNKLKRDSLD